MYSFILGLTLCADAFAVSVTNGIAIKNVRAHHAIKTAAFFAVFQAIMPLLGYYMGMRIDRIIRNFDHFIALFLLVAVGVNMIIEACKCCDESKKCFSTDCEIVSSKRLFVLGVATSIDAFAVGISLAIARSNIVQDVIVIGLVTFFSCVFGVFAGEKLGKKFQKNATIIGGIVLILIGINICISHIIA